LPISGKYALAENQKDPSGRSQPASRIHASVPEVTSLRHTRITEIALGAPACRSHFLKYLPLPQTTKMTRILTVVFAALILFGCSSKKSEYEKNFTNACLATSHGNSGMCKCTLSALEQNHSIDELEEMDKHPTQEFLKEAVTTAVSCRVNQ
jgi:hypothetical protein